MTAQSGLSPDGALADREFRGRVVESAVGAHLANAAAGGACELYYWRERSREVDFVLRRGKEDRLQKKLTITVDAAIYDGLYLAIGPRRISQFIEDLVRPHVLDEGLLEAYARDGRRREAGSRSR